MDQQTRERLGENVRNLPKMLSAWFMAAAAAFATWWVGLAEAQQVEYLQQLPWTLPAEAYPVVLGVIGLVLRAWPQKSLMPPPESGDGAASDQPNQ